MKLLHATWLRNLGGSSNLSRTPALFLWGDTWQAISNQKEANKVLYHPFSLTTKELREWLIKKQLLPDNITNAQVSLMLPSKAIKQKYTQSNKGMYSYLPIHAEDTLQKQYKYLPWAIEGLTLTPLDASIWLTKLPLSNKTSYLSEELIWWSHLQRWSLSIIAQGLWLPEVKIKRGQSSSAQARWVPLINHENERKRLEEFARSMPLVIFSKNQVIGKSGRNFKDEQTLDSQKEDKKSSLLPLQLSDKRLIISNLLEDLVDAQLRKNFKPKINGLDPLLTAWQKSLGSEDGFINLPEEDKNRLIQATKNWERGLSSNFKPAKTCLKLIAPKDDNDLWKLEFLLQVEANNEITIPAETVWNMNKASINIGDIKIDNPCEILLEGLGRALKIFPELERGLESPMPNSMKISSTEAFVLIRSAAKQLRSIGIGVMLPKSLSKGLASRLGITIKADLKDNSQGKLFGETLNWSWKLMIGGINLTMKELEIFAKKKNPIVNHKGTWIHLRQQDITHAEQFCSKQATLNLDDALRLTATEGNTLSKLPVHYFEAGPRLQTVLDQYHHRKEPKPLPAPEGFQGHLRPYQNKGLGWLAFLYRFKQGACLADDMGLGKTIQLLAFIQHLKIEAKLTKPILLIAPTSVLTNWEKESQKFTPKLSVLEHYGAKRASNIEELKQYVKGLDILITSYGLLCRDQEILSEIQWQGVVIDEAQAIKNPNTKQSILIREISNALQGDPLRIALTGTPIENRVSELWALMNFLNPKILGEENFFNQRYKLPIEHYGDMSSLKALKAQIRPFILRRLKTDKSIISDLPPKIELNEWVNLSEEQEILYTKAVESSLNEIATSPIGQRQGKTLGLLIRLKQICNHPALYLKEKTITNQFLERSGKLERLIAILEEIIESNDQAILFTQFVEWGHLLQTYFQKKWELEVPFLQGSTSKANRQSIVDHFQEETRGPKILLLSLKAGGIGLNLTKANHVFHIDRWWNPAVENQATDRAYRIGQTKRVLVHKFITKGSIEEKINEMINRKIDLATDIVGSGESWLGKLNMEELSELVTLDKNPTKF